jgi:pre-mRNA-splicing factor CDC5/CEF1
MLNEARARLANTKGKKAKRKAREKQLEEARRLASLQKKREMKAAGMLSKYKKKRKGIDYNAEIAFEHKPPPGFYDTSEEQQKEKTGALHKDFKPVRLDELEGKRRKDIEAGLIKKDKARKAILERKNMPLALAQQMQNQAGPAVKRGKLMLPAPQLSDGELRQIARMNEQEDIDGSDLAQQGAGGRATKMLLADYSATPNPMATPMRTPRATTSTGTDLLLQEANQLAKMQQLQSTLMGGEGTSIDSATFKGAMPESKTMSTPNPLATPLHAQQAGLSMLHQSHNRMIQSSGATPMVMSTPIRDGLHINRPGSSQAMTEFDAVDLETKRERDLQVQNVKFALASLPKPKNEYQVVLPDLAALDDDDEDMKDAKVEEDMEDVIAREKAQVKEERQRKLRMRSQVVQRNLPRTTMDLMVQATTSALKKAAEESENEQAASLITEELKRIVKYDRGFHPVKRQFECSFAKEPRRAGLLDYENMSEDQILQARSMIMEENQSLMKGNAHLREEHAKAFDAYLEGEAEGQNTSFPRFMAGLQQNFQNIVSEIERKGKQAKKLEKKVKIINGGHEKKEGDVLKRFESVHQRHALAKEKLGAFSMLKDLESEAAPQRIHALQNELEKEKSKEKELQKRYAQLTRGTPVP